METKSELRKKYYWNNRDKERSYYKEHVKKLKTQFVEMYGRKCVCCGETEIDFLTLDHVIPRTSKNRNETSRKGYHKAVQEYRPDLYQIMCYNCNCARRHGVCPHKRISLGVI